MGNLEFAVSYARSGLAVVPLHTIEEGGRCSCGHTPCKHKPGKHPRWHEEDLPNGLHSATFDVETVRRWWTRWPRANIGVVAGGKSGGLLIIDFDERADEIFPKWREAVGQVADRFPIVRTGRGYQVHLRIEGQLRPGEKIARGLPTSGGEKPPLLIESRGEGMYGIAPPSNHVSGNVYRMLQGDLTSIPTVSPGVADALLAAARSLAEWVEPSPPAPSPSGPLPFVSAFERRASRPSFDPSDRAEFWAQVWQRLDLHGLASLLSELSPTLRPTGGDGPYLGEMRCPKCGKSEAFTYPADGLRGVAIRCSRLDKCAFHVTLFDYLTAREGTTEKAIRVLCNAVGIEPPARSVRRVDRTGGGFGLPPEKARPANRSDYQQSRCGAAPAAVSTLRESNPSPGGAGERQAAWVRRSCAQWIERQPGVSLSEMWDGVAAVFRVQKPPLHPADLVNALEWLAVKGYIRKTTTREGATYESLRKYQGE